MSSTDPARPFSTGAHLGATDRRSVVGIPDRIAAITIASGYRPLLLGVFTIAVFFNITEMSDGSNVTRATSGELSPLLLVRLGIAACVCGIGGFAVTCDRRVRSLLRTVPGGLFLAIGIGFLMSSPFAIAETLKISVAASLIFLGYLMFAAALVREIRFEALVQSALAALTAFLLVTWGLYLFVPSIGVFQEYTSMTETVARMGGTTHPNGIGRNAAVTLLLALGLGRGLIATPRSDARSRRLLILASVAVIALGAMVEAKSRTAFIALAFSLVALMSDRLIGRRLIAGLAIGGTLLAGGVFALELYHSGEFFSDKMIATVTKSGTAHELTSATGRTDIWGQVLVLIAERPWFGWGLDAAASIDIEAYSTHNLLLNVTLSSGVFVGLLCFGLLLYTAWYGLRSDRPTIRGISMYVLVSGLVEDTVFESFPSVLTIFWIIFMLETCFVRPATEPGSLAPRKPKFNNDQLTTNEAN